MDMKLKYTETFVEGIPTLRFYLCSTQLKKFVSIGAVFKKTNSLQTCFIQKKCIFVTKCR